MNVPITRVIIWPLLAFFLSINLSFGTTNCFKTMSHFYHISSSDNLGGIDDGIKRGVDKDPDDVPVELYKGTYLTASHYSYSKLDPISGRIIDDIEMYLKTQKFEIVSSPDHGGNMDDTFFVIFDNGQKAVWKIHRERWYSNYRAEILAFELSESWGFKLVPITVEKEVDGLKGSVQLYVYSEYFISEEKQLNKLSAFDFLINNRDRVHESYELLKKSHNYFTDKKGKIVAIDNGISLAGDQGSYGRTFIERVFEIDEFLKTQESEAILQNLYMSSLSPNFREEVVKYIGSYETDRLIERIKIIVKYKKMKTPNLSPVQVISQMIDEEIIPEAMIKQFIEYIDDNIDQKQKYIDLIPTIKKKYDLIF